MLLHYQQNIKVILRYHRLCLIQSNDTVLSTAEEKLLMNSTDALGHLSDLLYNLDDSATTGSGSGTYCFHS